jgi:hypothetical protein
MDKNIGEMSKFLVFNSGEESHPNSPRIDFSFNTTIGTEMKFSAALTSSENQLLIC